MMNMQTDRWYPRFAPRATMRRSSLLLAAILAAWFSLSSPLPAGAASASALPATPVGNEVEVYDHVEARPAGQVPGTWTIHGYAFLADSNTQVFEDNGPLAVGTCARILYDISVEPQHLLLVIESRNSQDCSNHDDEAVDVHRYAIVESRPLGETEGNWLVGGVTYSVTDDSTLTENHGPAAVGACVKVHYTTETTPFEVWEIESKPQIACQGDGSGPDLEYETGLVTALPASGGEGDWYVDGQHFIANSQTGFDTGNGPLALGACVIVSYPDLSAAAALGYAAKAIASRPMDDCDDNKPDDEGLVQQRPIGGVGGIWMIGGITFTVWSEARIIGDPQVGSCVKYIYDPASNTICEIEVQEYADCFDDDDDGESQIYGIIAAVPANGVGLWELTVGATLTQSVLVSATTDISEFAGNFAAGMWVEARGVLVDGVLQASRIRPDDYEVGQVVIRLKAGVNVSATVASLISRYQLLPLKSPLPSGNIFLFATTENAVTLANRIQYDDDVVDGLDHIMWAEPNYVGRIPAGNPYRTWKWGGEDPTSYANQSAFAQVGLTVTAPDNGAGVTVAILDTGVFSAHPAMAGRLILAGATPDLIDEDRDPSDIGPGVGWGHGTHVAGIVAHIAPGANLMPIRVLDANGRGNTFVLAYAIEYAVTNGADIINLSMGADCDSDVLKEAIDAALVNNVLVVAAAGNDGSNVPQCPAKYFGVIGVTAVRSDNSVPEWANYGDWVQLAAPGEGITSTIVGPEGAGYASWSGTSMATPFVTGAAALVKQKYPAYKVTGLFSALVEQFTNISSTTGGRVERLLNISAALGPSGPAAPAYTLYLPTVGK